MTDEVSTARGQGDDMVHDPQSPDVDPGASSPDVVESRPSRQAAIRDRQRQRQKVHDTRRRRSKDIVRKFLFSEISPDFEIPPEPLGFEETQIYREDIKKYFSNKIELFPDFDGYLIPRDFHNIYRAEIGDQFPPDASARDLCGILRTVVNENFRTLIFAKCLIAILSVALVIGLTLAFPMQSTTSVHVTSGKNVIVVAPSIGDIVNFAAYFGLSIVLFIGLNQYAYVLNDRRSSRSCTKVGRDLQSVFKGIESAYRDALQNIQADENRGGADQVDQWPDRAAWWARLILWYPKRVEYLEKTFQIQMWRVRRWFAWWRIVGWLIMGAAWLTLSVGSYWYAMHLGWPATVLLVVYGTLIGLCSTVYWKPELDFVREYVGIGHWNRFDTFRSDDRVADMMRQNMHKIIREQRHP